MTFEGLSGPRGEHTAALIAASDAVFLTYDPLVNLTPLPLEDIPRHLQQMTQAAAGKPLILQEIGYPAVGQKGNQMQAIFFSKILPLIQQSKQIDAAFIFALHDYAPGTCQTWLGYYGLDKAGKERENNARDVLCTLGLRDNQGKPRPAYERVKNILTQQTSKKL